MNNYHESQCHYTDRCLVNMVIEQNSNGKQELFTVSEVYGMGVADFAIIDDHNAGKEHKERNYLPFKSIFQ